MPVKPPSVDRPALGADGRPRRPVPAPDPNLGTIPQFSPRAMTRAIQGAGLLYRWSRALPCPCRLSATEQPDPTCVLCVGWGWTYVHPNAARMRHQTIDYIEVSCGFAQASRRTDVQQPGGAWEYGEAMLTVQGEAKVGYRDRFIGCEQEMPWTELLTRLGDVETGSLVPVGLVGRTADEREGAMRYEPCAVNFVRDTSTIYWEGTDWRVRGGTLTEPRRLEWLPGRGPTAGTRYTIHYTSHPVWIVDDGTFAVQSLRGPASELNGAAVVQSLPSTFRVKLDYLTVQAGS